MKTLKELSLANRSVLVRCDFNVPLDKKGNILDDFRIRKAIPTIKYLIENNARIVLMSHLGDPDGKIMPELKMDKVAEKLSELLALPINKLDDCVGPQIEAEVNKLESGQIILLENVRFHKEEMENNLEFAKQLSFLGDIYVNEAFSVCHRDQASVTGVAKLLPNCAGFLLEKEIEVLSKVMSNPEHPMVAIVGGKKVETKSKFIDNISKVADTVIVSGLIAKEISEKNIKLKAADKIVSPVGKLDSLDINKDSIKLFKEEILKAKTVLWNGPFGKFEEKKYSSGSLAIAKAIVESGAFSVVGGGETVEFLNKQSMISSFSHVSTGGGAMLSYLAGDKLPGLAALD